MVFELSSKTVVELKSFMALSTKKNALEHIEYDDLTFYAFLVSESGREELMANGMLSVCEGAICCLNEDQQILKQKRGPLIGPLRQLQVLLPHKYSLLIIL